MNKMINVKGKEISEDTGVEASKKHCNFDDKVPIIEIYDCPGYGKRAVVRLSDHNIEKIKQGNKSIVIDLSGLYCTANWDGDRLHDYTKDVNGGYLTNCTHTFGRIKT